MFPPLCSSCRELLPNGVNVWDGMNRLGKCFIITLKYMDYLMSGTNKAPASSGSVFIHIV